MHLLAFTSGPADGNVQTCQAESTTEANIVGVTRDRVFFNTNEIRSNIWMTRLE